MKETHLVLYDGVCGFCNRSISYLIRLDRNRRFLYAPLQGKTATGILSGVQANNKELKTVILVQDYQTQSSSLLFRSEAIFQILAELGGIWQILSWLRIIPLPIRDLAYNFIARNRYRWFGKYNECKLPAPEIRDLFLP